MTSKIVAIINCQLPETVPRLREAGAVLRRSRCGSAGGILKQDLTRKTQFIRKSLRDEYVADLVESGELVMRTGAKGGEVYTLRN